MLVLLSCFSKYQIINLRHYPTGSTYSSDVPCLYGLEIPPVVNYMSACDKTCQTEERKLLMKFYRATNGPNWRRFHKNWGNKNISHCLREGIACDEKTRHVIALSLMSNNGMTGEVKFLNRLKYLFGVCLGGNLHLSGEVSQLLRTFSPYLLRFDFAFTNIQGKLPDTIASDKPLLGKIQLAGNLKISGELPKNIGDLKNLHVLSIGRTRITGKVPLSITRLRKLWFLELDHLSLKGDLLCLQNISSLKYIKLQNNQLSGKIPHDFGEWFPNVLEIDFHNNLLSGMIPTSIGKLKELKVLNLATNKHINGSLPASFKYLLNLEYIDISYTGINGVEKGFQLSTSRLSHFIARGT